MPSPLVMRFSAPRLQDDVAADRVAVADVAGERPGHRLQSDVRMRLHPHARDLRARTGRGSTTRRRAEGRAAGASGAPTSRGRRPAALRAIRAAARADRRTRCWTRRAPRRRRPVWSSHEAGLVRPVDREALDVVAAQVAHDERAARNDRLAARSRHRRGACSTRMPPRPCPLNAGSISVCGKTSRPCVSGSNSVNPPSTSPTQIS